MFESITAILMVLGELIDPTTHIVSYAFCPFIFGGSAIYAIVRWVKLEENQKREIIWSILVIILAVLVLVFVGLNTFLWLNDIMFFIFIVLRFSLLFILVILANPYIKWAPLKGPFITKENMEKI
ncbi:MAG: hypothetical protein KAJ76_02875 [Candidatus Heimdallarchaeota archaeon]|nr:hypothetical protein [Candidatus Heimdallarchaeota archaeon]MCK5158866.1 hypothetical protein [Candidatus Heimdallarchaeota archaeon]MCK5297823.1 hypothetical protein [Candidatus Heimdallarchaeota archaeon]